jgi:hypothetical protein
MLNLSRRGGSQDCPAVWLISSTTDSDRRVQPEQPTNDLEPFVFLRWFWPANWLIQGHQRGQWCCQRGPVRYHLQFGITDLGSNLIHPNLRRDPHKFERYDPPSHKFTLRRFCERRPQLGCASFASESASSAASRSSSLNHSASKSATLSGACSANQMVKLSCNSSIVRFGSGSR